MFAIDQYRKLIQSQYRTNPGSHPMTFEAYLPSPHFCPSPFGRGFFYGFADCHRRRGVLE